MYESLEHAVLNLTVPIALLILFSAIIINFLLYEDEEVKTFKKSPVETFSMTAFVLVLYLLVINKLGVYTINQMTKLLQYIGLVVFIFGTAINILGRLYLGHNWSNQVRVRGQHTLVDKGPFKWVRHPLYASIIIMIYAAGFIYHNYLVVILNTIVFIPIMTYRAKQEENALIESVEGYADYMKKTGRFVPKVRTNESH
jgi:protein-S-isoprenylcysteine O-methyltransferase Ste14